MKVIIAGGRDFSACDEDFDLLYELHEKYHFTEVVSGCASGADTFGEVWTDENWGDDVKRHIKLFPADWDNLDVTPCVIGTNRYRKKYNKLAGFNRNEQMAIYADAIILFEGGSGTEHMWRKAIEHGLEILYDEGEHIMDIGSGKGYPSSALSNFAGHRFEIDGIQCNSMEGFLQSLKFSGVDMQEYVCTLIGKGAKFKGKKKKWYTKQILFWKGKEIDRHSKEYQDLITKAYKCMFRDSESFRKALKASQNATLTHSMGKNDPHRTILTEKEFVSRLKKLREEL
jgi:hypothetical protein